MGASDGAMMRMCARRGKWAIDVVGGTRGCRGVFIRRGKVVQAPGGTSAAGWYKRGMDKAIVHALPLSWLHATVLCLLKPPGSDEIWSDAP